MPPLTREQRAAKAKAEISTQFNSKQQVFLEFVLSHYVANGSEELDQEELTPLLRLKYRDSLADAVCGSEQPAGYRPGVCGVPEIALRGGVLTGVRRRVGAGVCFRAFRGFRGNRRS